MNPHYYVGVDVGTGSARAAIVDATGCIRAVHSEDIRTWYPASGYVEQSSQDIWQAVCRCVRSVVAEVGLDARSIRGVGFDATCSLVVLDAEDNPLSVSPSGSMEQNIIVWMDHRATEQAERINLTRHEVLKFVGGVISPEMETPKILWLKENLPETFHCARRFMDLADFLSYRATGNDTRSLCTTVCKWTFPGHRLAQEKGTETGWDESFFRAVGLEDLANEGFTRIGQRIRPMGETLPHGLSARSGVELGLCEGTPVGVGAIDAHAGGIGVLGASVAGEQVTEHSFEQRLALIGGTSSCHMAVTSSVRFIHGVWGPYYSAMVPGMWLAEGGQSATGALIDHVIMSHPRYADLRNMATQTQMSIYDVLNNHLDGMAKNIRFPALLTKEIHVLDYFHGNRSPLADPTLKGMISGLSLTTSLDDLALLYLATVQAIAYGTRHIIKEMNKQGYKIDTLFACGGGTKNRVFLREHADATSCRIVLPRHPDHAVVLGAAILGAVASGACATILDGMQRMGSVHRVIEPAGGPTRAYHNAKYEIYRRMSEDQLAYRQAMSDWEDAL